MLKGKHQTLKIVVVGRSIERRRRYAMQVHTRVGRDYNNGTALEVYPCIAQDLMFGSRGFESKLIDLMFGRGTYSQDLMFGSRGFESKLIDLMFERGAYSQDLMFGSRGFESFVDRLQQRCCSCSVPMFCPRPNVWKQRVRILC